MNTFELPTRSGAYRWYYVDVTSGDYSAVFIFMLGSLFSARYAEAATRGGLPREYAAVNFALYEKGTRRQWVLSEYDDARVEEGGRELRIGASWLRYADGRLQGRVEDRTTPFLLTGWGRPTTVTLDFTPEGPTAPEVELVLGRSHRWRPIAARGSAVVTLPELGLTLRGHGYHDGNHGDVPLWRDLRGWDWVRVHTPEATEITYRPWAAAPATLVRVDARHAEVRRAPLPEPLSTRSAWGLRVPRAPGMTVAPRLLESSPFYARTEALEGDRAALGEVADFERFVRPSIRWMASFRTRRGVA